MKKTTFSRNRYNTNTSFIDFLFILTAGFALLFILSYLLITPKKVTVDPGRKDLAQYIIRIEWQDGSNDDVDMWAACPDGSKISFQSKDNGYAHLERDDLGTTNDIISTKNEEHLVIREGIPGTYIINVHMYRKADAESANVKFELIQIHPFKKHVQGVVTLTTAFQEETIVSFELGEKGVWKQLLTLKEDFIKRLAIQHVEGMMATP